MVDPVNTKRRYHSPERRERANATSRQIARAAEALFAARGYAAVAMKEIAAAAGVSPATLYLHFDGKAAIVAALSQAITDAPDLSVELVEGSDSADSAIRLGARIFRELNERSWLVAEILRSHGETDPALGVLAEDWRGRHLDAVRRGLQALSQAGQLRPTLEISRAVDIMYAVGGTEVFRSLVRDRGWKPDEYEEWLAGWATRELLGPNAGAPPEAT